MKHRASFAAAKLSSISSYRARAGTGVFRAMTILVCLAFSLTPTLAKADTICFLGVLKLRNSGHAEQHNYVINTAAEWQSLWEKIFSNTSEKPPLPEIDFARRTIIAVFQGEQPTGGYEISIVEIVETENLLEVTVKAFAPGERCVVTGLVTKPFCIVEIEKTDKEVLFHVKQKVRNCG